MMPRTLCLSLGAALTFSACAPHIAPYRPKRRAFKAGKYDKIEKPAPGSLYSANTRGFFEDNVAGRVGDVLVVRIDERESALRDATSKLSKKNETAYGVPNALGLMSKLQEKVPEVDPTALFGSQSDSSFDGKGKLARRGQLNATLPVRVRRVLPNGDLYVEGTKVVMVGSEEHHIYVSGIVRPFDISADNVVLSSRIADAEIEYTGRGDVSDQQRPGWLSRTLGTLWPF